MSRMRYVWDRISDAFTLQALLFFLFPTGIIVGLALWLSAATTFIKLFAPLSYLLVTLVVLLLFGLLFVTGISVAKQLGWNPARWRRRAKNPTRDAALKDVIAYVAYEAAYGINNVNAKTPAAAVANEIMDRVAENEMAVWGRIGNLPISRIRMGDLPYCTLNIATLSITRAGEWGSTEFKDIQLNWKQVRRTWPKPPLWQRVVGPIRVPGQKKELTGE